MRRRVVVFATSSAVRTLPVLSDRADDRRLRFILDARASCSTSLSPLAMTTSCPALVAWRAQRADHVVAFRVPPKSGRCGATNTEQVSVQPLRGSRSAVDTSHRPAAGSLCTRPQAAAKLFCPLSQPARRSRRSHREPSAPTALCADTPRLAPRRRMRASSEQRGY